MPSNSPAPPRNLAYNVLEALPNDIDRLASSLARLNVSNNALDDLPGSFLSLTSLRQLRLDCNNLATLPEHISRLGELEVLHCSKCMLTTLPGSLPLLESLTDLVLDHNALLSLAVVPPLDEDAFGDADEWDVVPTPGGGVQYYNRATGVSRSTKPASILAAEQAEADLDLLGGKDVSSLVKGTAAYAARRRALGRDGVKEWSLEANVKKRTLVHRNNVNGRATRNLPPALDSFSKFLALRRLSVAHNKLISLPDGLADMYVLETFVCSHNAITTLPPFGRVDGGNPEIGQGRRSVLSTVVAGSNQLKGLPAEMAQLVPTLTHLGEFCRRRSSPANRPPPRCEHERHRRSGAVDR